MIGLALLIGFVLAAVFAVLTKPKEDEPDILLLEERITDWPPYPEWPGYPEWKE